MKAIRTRCGQVQLTMSEDDALILLAMHGNTAYFGDHCKIVETTLHLETIQMKYQAASKTFTFLESFVPLTGKVWGTLLPLFTKSKS